MSEKCPHAAWEDYGRGRRCADCREYLGPSEPAKPTAAELRNDLYVKWHPRRIEDDTAWIAAMDAYAAAVAEEATAKERERCAAIVNAVAQEFGPRFVGLGVISVRIREGG